MNWTSQVAHVMAKDARQQRWVLGLVGVTVVLDTVIAMGLVFGPGGLDTATRFSVSSAPTGLSLLAAAIATVLLIQADSPSRDDAFWTTRPLTPGAVFAAKLATIAGFAVLLPLAGQTVALLDLGVPAGDLPAHLGRGLVFQASIMGVAAFVAGVTPDLRTFLVAMLGLVIGWMTIESVAFGVRTYPGLGRYPFDATLARAAVLLAGGALALLVQFRTRRLSRTLAVATVLAVAWLVVPPLLPSAPPTVTSHDPRLRPVTAPAPLIAEDIEVLGLSVSPAAMVPTVVNTWNVRAQLALHGADPAHDYRIRQLLVDYVSADGGRARKGDYQSIWLGARNGPIAASTVARGPGSLTADVRVGTLDDAQLAAVQAGHAHLDLVMSVEVLRPATTTVLPLREGARAQVSGHRLVVERVGPPVLDNLIRIRMEQALSSALRTLPGPDDVRYELRLPGGGEPVPLAPSAQGGTVGRLVTPGSQTRTWAYRLGTVGGDGDTAPLTAAALRGADLVVHATRPAGEYPLVVTLDDLPPGIPDWR